MKSVREQEKRYCKKHCNAT
ncbi:hypothetical protein D7I46_10360 [Lactococcus allomyrinae]|uniref:Uncharacterized protein n=1 Tax=Lactococcus allomyrinae TaxID=2419773 RepID=A0A387BH61_9LACT|nr:hypothetical protein D7I46_10360 [Lactococcus allomyrinae]